MSCRYPIEISVGCLPFLFAGLGVASVLSILDRASGVWLAAGTILLVWWLGAAADGPEAYARVQGFVGSWFGLILLFGWLYLRGPSRHGAVLFGVFLAFGLLVYPLMVPFPVLFLAPFAWRQWRQRESRAWPGRIKALRGPRSRARASLMIGGLVVAVPVAAVLVRGFVEKVRKARSNRRYVDTGVMQAGAQGVEHRVVEHAFARRPDGIDLLQAAVARAHAGGENEKRGRHRG